MSDVPIRFRAATDETPLARFLLIGGVLLGLAVLLFALLIVVFSEALRDGAVAAVASLANPEAASAIRLTLIVAAIAVPLNAVFGIAATWFITKFDFRGKAFLITLIDLPFSVSPVVAGLCIVLTFGVNSLIGGVLVGHGFPIVFALPGIVMASVFVTFPFVARELIPVAQLADRVGLSQTPCWKRVQKLDAAGVITHRVAIVDPRKVGLGLTVLCEIEAMDHTPALRDKFLSVLDSFPEIMEVQRSSGQSDYMLHILVADMPTYDTVYRRLTETVALKGVRSRFVMKVVHRKLALPLQAGTQSTALRP